MNCVGHFYLNMSSECKSMTGYSLRLVACFLMVSCFWLVSSCPTPILLPLMSHLVFSLLSLLNCSQLSAWYYDSRVISCFPLKIETLSESRLMIGFQKPSWDFQTCSQVVTVGLWTSEITNYNLGWKCALMLPP